MLSIAVDLLFIGIIISFIVDHSGIIDSIKKLISKVLVGIKTTSYSIKPFDCSLCMTWWVGLIYIISIGSFSLPALVMVALFSYLSSHISLLLVALKDLIGVLINKIIDYTNEI